LIDAVFLYERDARRRQGAALREAQTYGGRFRTGVHDLEVDPARRKIFSERINAKAGGAARARVTNGKNGGLGTGCQRGHGHGNALCAAGRGCHRGGDGGIGEHAQIAGLLAERQRRGPVQRAPARGDIDRAGIKRRMQYEPSPSLLSLQGPEHLADQGWYCLVCHCKPTGTVLTEQQPRTASEVVAWSHLQWLLLLRKLAHFGCT